MGHGAIELTVMCDYTLIRAFDPDYYKAYAHNPISTFLGYLKIIRKDKNNKKGIVFFSFSNFILPNHNF